MISKLKLLEQDTVSTIEKKILSMDNLLIKYNHHYYNNDDPIVNDNEYDELYKYLCKCLDLYPVFKDKVSALHQVGAPLKGGFLTYKHKTNMLSLNNAFSLKDLKAFEKRIHDISDNGTVNFLLRTKVRWSSY